ncbi:membrane-bound dehydrogenase domain protein [Planctopirus limnophila DSM 3776]|uniref:Membrane-bound dehydrogenase domain protein n=1 Tax=Planctopirus limnophila (strain ATCC 43296 / DSM 3776 / IFAM 1008 / Mu 290) TaxID=521674 RepID=D5SPH4_PLAL2|nr:PVC-type heme-binding CxxCH protein [Planctopirus limnophila]ADG66204.1 membrane-bound dehydrogenase domain protein [Planctopirus limnophila DSM 3776]
MYQSVWPSLTFSLCLLASTSANAGEAVLVEAPPEKSAGIVVANLEQTPAKQPAQTAAAKQPPAAPVKQPVRFVRIELPGEKRILTLAEVEVFSAGKNIAREGKATQSSTHGDGVASRAVDGNKHPDWSKGGQTHTSDDGEQQPWWELDLGKPANIEKIAVWNRTGFENRLSGFSLILLDADRKELFRKADIAAPQGLEIDLGKSGELRYLAYDGKPGKAMPKGGDSSSGASAEPPLANVPADYRDPVPFALQKDDVVAILGNGLADRMQHDGWLETLLQSQLVGKNVRIRDMSASGDRPYSFPRSSGQISITSYLQHVKPTVVFAFFGYNESFDTKPEEYKRQLLEFVKKTRGAKPDGKDFPRIVLFSPIAQEDTGNPNVPDGRAQNVRLAALTRATQEAAQEAGVAFIDLFHPSLKLYEKASQPLTINSVHLTEEGNRQLAEVIASELLGKPVSSSQASEKLRQAVLDKNLHWWNRYRASDGNDVWGSRSTLTFVNNQSNADVLKPELEMLDVMTANRDEVVWARAAGKDKAVDDSNVPPAVPVISNVGGGSKSSSAMKEGTLSYISGEEGLKQLAVAKGFEVSLFADEQRFPQLVNPVQLQFDTKDRLWAAVWPTYPKWEPHQEMTDALIILHDDNGDGVADRSTEFAKVQNPLGFEFWNDGVIVTCQSELLFLQDTNGDDLADRRITLLQGLDSSDTHHGANNLIYGPDGGIYWQSGVFMVHNHEHPWGPSLQSTASAMYRFDPRRFTISMHAINSPNPHGTSFDYWGYQYATDGTGGNAYQVRPEGNGFKMHQLLKKEVRPVTASEIVSSSHFPESMQGDFLICNVIGFLGIKHYDLERNPETGTVWGEPAGDQLTVTVTNANGSKTEDKSRGLLMSGDKNFRPSDAIFAPDGTLYFADWHNAIIGHMQHNVRDPNRDHSHGRIYRVKAVDRPLQKPVPIDGQPIAKLLDNLKSPVDGIRHRTRVELSERDSKEVIAATKEWIKQFDPNKREDAHHLLEALWLHQQHNVKDLQLLEMVLNSPEPHARNAAKTVKHFWFNVEKTLRGGIVAGAELASSQKSGILSDTPELTTIRIATIPEKMMYDVKELTVKPGKKVRLKFANYDFMPHNILLVKPGTADDVGIAAINLGARGFDKGFVPESTDILWHSSLVDFGQEQVIEFTAPTEEGAYPYICSFPGHHRLMRGMLFVTNDLKAFLAKNPQQEIKVTEWKLDDFAADLKRVSQHRNFAEGKKHFTTLGCVQCHRLGKDESTATPALDGIAQAVGPNIDEVVKKYKRDPNVLLREILESSRNIDEKYRQVVVVLDDGKSYTGVVAAEDNNTLTLLAGSPPKRVDIPKKSIDDRVASPVSIMPSGLLNTLDKEQILDLMAYLLAAGNAHDSAFHHGH